MVQDSTGGCDAVSNVLVSEGEDERFVDGGEKNLSKSLVSVIVLIKECGGGVESIVKFGDLSASWVGWDDGYISGVEGNDKRDGI